MHEESEAMKKFQKELNAGTVSLVLLELLDRAAEPMYGYQISKLLEGPAEGAPVMKQGTLYPVLRGMEKGGLLSSRVEPSTTGPPRRYYGITASGRHTLAQWRAAWRRTRDFVDRILENGTGAGTPAS